MVRREKERRYQKEKISDGRERTQQHPMAPKMSAKVLGGGEERRVRDKIPDLIF